MLRLSTMVFTMLGLALLTPAAYSQDAEQAEQEAQERRARMEELRQLNQAEREAKRIERQRQIDSLTDEQRAAVRERQRIREARGTRQRGQRPPRRRGPVNSDQDSADAENTE